MLLPGRTIRLRVRPAPRPFSTPDGAGVKRRPATGGSLVRGLPFGWLLVFFLLPFGSS